MTILERILTAVLIPALLMLTVPQLGPVVSQRADDRGTSSAEASALGALGMLLTGTSTQENELYTLTLEAPDEAGPNESFTVSATLEAKAELQFAALTLALPEGMSSSSPQLAEFQQSMSAGDTLTGDFSIQAAETGSYTLTLESRGKPPEADSQSLNTTVTVNVAEAGPTATFSFAPQQAETSQEVTFDASASSAAQGSIESYQWDFGDGETAEGADQDVTTHTYQDPGNYQVTLTVTDSQGGQASATQQITVAQGNERPQATITVGTQEPKAGQPITFDGSGSTDPDGQIQNYRWTLGDGTVLEGADQATVTHTYQEPGNYQISLVVTDNEGTASQPRTVSLNVERAPTLFEQIPTAVWIGVGVAAVAGVVYYLTTQGTGGGPSDGEPATGDVQSELQSRARNFISESGMPFEGVTGISRQAQVQTLDRAQWVRQLLDRALIIHTQDGFSIRRYGEMSDAEQSKFNARSDELNAGSLLGFVSDRVSPGDTIYKLTWRTADGETVESWAVVGSDGRLKLDTLISFFPLDP